MRVNGKLYRVQNAKGEGVYFGSDIIPNENSQRHPIPQDDAALAHDFQWEFTQNCLFGFKSIEQLRSWIFNSVWRQQLSEAGFEIVVFEGEFYAGDTQAFFYPDKVQRVGSFSFTQLPTAVDV